MSMEIPVLNKKIQSAVRYKDILTVLLRYGFEDVVIETGIDQWLASIGAERIVPRPERLRDKLPRAVRLRKALEDLGPIFIKLGQVLSTRPDLIPLEWAEEFSLLQSDCPKLPFSEIEQSLKIEYGESFQELFRSIDPHPLAAASLAQVHRAELQDGTQVVLKVLRPGVRRLIEADIEVLQSFAQFVETHFKQLGYSPHQVVNEFSRELSRETDLVREGRATDRLRSLFRADDEVTFPKVYWKATTVNVLALEYIDGTLLSRCDLDEIATSERQKLVEIGTNAVLRQCLEFGFFHADPHPGNLYMLPGPRLCFIDCGMTGLLDRHSTDLLADLVAGVVTKDLERTVQAILGLTDADPLLADERSFRVEVWQIMSQFDQGTLESIEVGKVLNQLFEFFRRYNIHCPSDIVFLIKAVTTIEGVGEKIHPEFDIVACGAPYIEELVSKRYGMKAIRTRLEKTFFKYAELIEELPQGIQGILGQVRRNQFAVKLEHSGINRLVHTLEHASRNISGALLVAALTVGSSIIILADRVSGGAGYLQGLGVVGLIISLIFTAIILTRNYFSK